MNAGGSAPGVSAATPPVPESLLVPLLDAAAGVLSQLDPGDVPATLRALAGFDRRGLQTGAARQQLRRALEVDESFRVLVAEEFGARPEVVEALGDWNVGVARARVEHAAARSDLAWLASGLYALRPTGWEFGLGIATAVAEQLRATRESQDDAKAAELQLHAAEDARRRAEESQAQALADVGRLQEDLREERRARRTRELGSERELAAARGRLDEAELAVDAARAAADGAEERLRREADRARAAEQRSRELQRELREHERDAEVTRRATWEATDLEVLQAARADVRQLGERLDALARRARDGAGAVGTDRPGAGPSAPAGDVDVRRPRAVCPPGLRADSRAGLDAMLRTRGIVLVVDGYNVSMAGWGNVAPAAQRERLVAALHGLHLRVRCDVVVVFDGADVDVVPSPSRSGVRVMFSAAGEEADAVIVREVEGLPLRVPALVVSSDRWVHEHAERAGAVVVPTPALLELLAR